MAPGSVTSSRIRSESDRARSASSLRSRRASARPSREVAALCRRVPLPQPAIADGRERRGRRRPRSSTVDRTADQAGRSLTFLDNPHYADALRGTRAARLSRCRRAMRRAFPQARSRSWSPSPIAPSRASLAHLFPSRRCARSSACGREGVSPGAFVHRDGPARSRRHASIPAPSSAPAPRSAPAPSSPRMPSSARGADRPRLLDRRRRHGHSRADRQPRHPPSRRAHRPGRLRLRHGRRAAT